MKTVMLELPDSLDEKEAKNLFAAKLYESGDLTLGQAAEVAGHSKREFMDMLSKYNVSIFQLSPQELETDIANAQHHHL